MDCSIHKSPIATSPFCLSSARFGASSFSILQLAERSRSLHIAGWGGGCFRERTTPLCCVHSICYLRPFLPNLRLPGRSILSEVQLPLLVGRVIFLPLKRVNAAFVPSGLYDSSLARSARNAVRETTRPVGYGLSEPFSNCTSRMRAEVAH